MTLFWIIAAGMMILAMAFVVPPFVRKLTRPGVSQDELNLSVIKQQLAELETDLANGALDKGQYEAARKDLERELLSDISAENGATEAIAEKTGRWALAVAGIGIPLLTLALYQAIGNQEIIPLLAGSAQQTQANHTTSSADPARDLPPMEELVAKLAERLRQDPDNIEGWMMLGRSYMAMGQTEQALKSYETAYSLAPDNPGLLLNYAEALAKLHGNRLTGRPAALIERAVELEPTNPNGLWMRGLVYYEQGAFTKAVRSWERLTLLLPAQGEDTEALAAYIEEAKARAATETSVPATAAAPMPAERTEPATAKPASQTAVKVLVSLHPEFQDKVTAEDRVFIFARALQGPPMPLAAVRKQVKDLPVSLTLDDSMAMMPQLTLSSYPRVLVGARISRSGNATPQSGDLQGEISPVEPGQGAVVEIVINSIRP